MSLLTKITNKTFPTDWIIAICNTDADGIRILRFSGTEEHVKELLVKLVSEDRESDTENWEHGTESVEDVKDKSGGLGYEFYAYACYSNYHIDYTAKEFAHVAEIM